MKDEREPFPAFLETLNDLQLVVMQHEAREVNDEITVAAVLSELKKRVTEQRIAMTRRQAGEG